MSTRQVITPAMHELRAAISEAENISAKPELSKRDETRINVLLAKIAALKQAAMAPDDYVKRWFNAFMKGGAVPESPEQRAAMLAGSQTITYTQGAAGGFLVPTEFNDALVYGLAQVDPLFDKNAVTFIKSKGFALRPFKAPAWDLSTIIATKVTEANQQADGAVQAVATQQLNSFTYRTTLAASFEFEEDDFEPTMEQMINAFEWSFARGIGADLINGNGTTAPQGIVTGAVNSGYTTATTGKISLTDILSIYFALNRIYRVQPKCAWVMNDTVYQFVRAAVDGSQRPLLNVNKDKETLLGKPVLISPTMGSTPNSKGIIFGDLSRYFVRVSDVSVTRNLEAPGYIEKGIGLYTARLRCDAKILDPTGGGVPPIIYATLR